MDIKEIEERLARLESRLAKPAAAGEPIIVEGEEKITDMGGLQERIQELEDLLLLIEIENTKIKEKVIGSANLEAPLAALDRIQKLEEKVAALKTSDTEELEKKIGDMEGYLTKELAEFDKRLSRLEEHFHERPKIKPEAKAERRYKQESSNILEEVQKILEG